MCCLFKSLNGFCISRITIGCTFEKLWKIRCRSLRNLSQNALLMANEVDPEKRRRELIERRQKESGWWMVIHWLGSLRLAMLLLGTIAVACATATIYESRHNTQIAHAYFYKNPFFIMWLLVLCLNLFCAALTRYPWQRKHTGFVVTHMGIITLLFGAMIGMISGFEGNIVLRKDDSPQNRIVVNETMLHVESPKDGAAYTIDFNVTVNPPTSERPRILKVPDSELKIVVSEYQENLQPMSVLKEASDSEGVPGVALKFSSGMMKQGTGTALLLKPEDASVFEFFGMARVEWLEKLPALSSSDPSLAQTIPFHEVRVLFEKQPEQPIIQNEQGEPAPFTLSLVPAEKGGGYAVVIEDESGNSFAYPVKKYLNKKIPWMDKKTVFLISHYWPDFKMQDGKPATLSDSPNNPTVLVHVEGRMTPAGRASATLPRPVLQMAPQSDGAIAWQVSRQGIVTKSGVVKHGESFQPGWADWAIQVADYKAKAKLEMEFQPMSQPVGPMQAKNVWPGLKARLRASDGSLGPEKWLVSGQPVTLEVGDRSVTTAFGLRTVRVPFSLKLESFEVPRDEGTDTPANFISTVEFKDFKTGECQFKRIEMNHPASHPGRWWHVLTGWGNYKFSQAGWDPENLDETTLQVLHDPGWLLKWVGSLMLCAGIFIMFYMKPYGRKKEVGSSQSRITAQSEGVGAK